MWEDLRRRVLTAVVLACLGRGASWLGELVFLIFVLILVGVLTWELARLLEASEVKALALGIGVAAGFTAANFLPGPAWWLLLSGLAALSMLFVRRHKPAYLLFSLAILFAAEGLVFHRDLFGLTWMVWLVLVVAVTDIFGYFAGRMLGGPKFWPSVSPKKTWSGTVAGWVGSGLVGLVFMALTPAGFELVPISILLSFASQLGDIAESALKRRMGAKDSSNLLPGHGGVFDRFDGMMGAALALLLVESVTRFPPPMP